MTNLETKVKIINLIKQIMIYYNELEKKNISHPTIYYTHREYDSNVTEFEGLSNSNKIVFATKLDKMHIPGIMQIFQGIYDNNYWIFEKEEWALDNIYESIDSEYPDDNIINSLMSYNNVNSWIQVLNQYNINIENNDDIENNDNNNNYYDSIPLVCTEYYKSKKRQKVYTLEMIYKLLDTCL